MDQNNASQQGAGDNAGPSQAVNPVIVLWGGASFVLAIIILVVSKSGPIAHAGFFGKLFGFIVAVPCGLIGALIGDAIRRFVIPDAVITTGGFFSLLKEKMFWMVGPQAIGLFIGVFLGFSIILH